MGEDEVKELNKFKNGLMRSSNLTHRLYEMKKKMHYETILSRAEIWFPKMTEEEKKKLAEYKPPKEQKKQVDEGEGPWFSYEELKTKPWKLERDKLEKYLRAADFEKVFDMTKEEFYKLPLWKQQR